MIEEEIDKAVQILREGGVVIFPTDTVWGIGVSIERLDGVKRLYDLKGREKNKPTAVLVADLDMAQSLGVIDSKVIALANKFWPGDLTIIVKAKETVTAPIKNQTGTVGLRQPDHPVTLALLKKLGTGIVAASANFAGQSAPVKKELIDQVLLDKVDYLVSGESGGKLPSTVLDTTSQPYKIIREGAIKKKLLLACLPLDNAWPTS